MGSSADYSLLLANINKHISPNADEADFFKSIIQFRNLPKKSFLQREGEPCQMINWVQSGALRAFYVDHEGRDSTIMFAIRDWWVTDMHAFANRRTAMQHIVAIEDSQVFQLSRDHFEKLLGKVPTFERYFRIIFQNAYIREQLRVLQSLSITAEERYLQFLEKYPQLIPHITQKQIASYLGVSPEFLSVVRKKMAKKKIS